MKITGGTNSLQSPLISLTTNIHSRVNETEIPRGLTLNQILHVWTDEIIKAEKKFLFLVSVKRKSFFVWKQIITVNCYTTTESESCCCGLMKARHAAESPPQH